MTIYGAITFFDDDMSGYILGTDSNTGMSSTQGHIMDGWSTKAFIGSNHLAILTGEFCMPLQSIQEGEDNADSLSRRLLSQFIGIFDDIEEGTSFEDFPILQASPLYRILLAKLEPSTLDLYTVSNITDQPHVAERLYRMQKGVHEDNSHSWSGFPGADMQHHEHPSANFGRAIFALGNFLTLPNKMREALKYDPGPPQFHMVSDRGIAELEVRLASHDALATE
ncbi:MAG: hypothetical protein ACE5DM_04755 [Candidatus Nanoarchaeia archaeon]